MAHVHIVMYTSIQACFLYFTHHPYMSLFSILVTCMHEHVRTFMIVCSHHLIQQNKRHKRVDQSRTSLWTYNIMFQPSDCLVPSPLPGQGRGSGTHLFTHPQNYPIVDTHFMYCADSLIPRHSRVPTQKRIWYFLRLFLAFAESSRCKMHVPKYHVIIRYGNCWFDAGSNPLYILVKACTTEIIAPRALSASRPHPRSIISVVYERKRWFVARIVVR